MHSNETRATSPARIERFASLCRPERLLELGYHFTLFDAGEKKVARYQQYFTVKNAIERIRQRDADGRRKGGVVWHTQGSGKSLTMVMLAKAIARENLLDYKLILVTDRVDLDDQIYKTFQPLRHGAAPGQERARPRRPDRMAPRAASSPRSSTSSKTAILKGNLRNRQRQHLRAGR